MTDNWPLGQVQHRDRNGFDFHAEMRYEGFFLGGTQPIFQEAAIRKMSKTTSHLTNLQSLLFPFPHHPQVIICLPHF